MDRMPTCLSPSSTVRDLTTSITDIDDGQMQDTGSLIVRNRWWSVSSWLRWKPTSMEALIRSERKLLSSVWNLLENKFVSVGNGSKRLRTVCLNPESKKTPLVMIHGMGSGVGLWVLNLEPLSKYRPVYAFDALGFGRSSRPNFSKDAMLAELEFVESIEEWRQEMNLDKFILMGHSLGGFLAASYTHRYPDRVRHLVLVDPWGFPERPPESERKLTVPAWVRVIATMMTPFNPLAALRAAGPWGPVLVSRFRPDLMRKFNHLFEDDTVAQYIYHCNAQKPSGEAAFKNMTESFGWAKNPMINRIADIPKHVPITNIYGSRSWIDSSVGYQMKYLRQDSYVHVEVIRGAGHHVYADQADNFNEVVNRIGKYVDLDIDSPVTRSSRRRRLISECSPGNRSMDHFPRRRRQRSESEVSEGSPVRETTTSPQKPILKHSASSPDFATLPKFQLGEFESSVAKLTLEEESGQPNVEDGEDNR